MSDKKGLGAAPRFLSRYELKERIGAGGMGTVYRAVDRRSRATVAIKILHPHFEADPAYLERFRREAQIASLLDSPHMVSVLDSGSDRGHHFIVSEFVGGAKLVEVLEQGRLEPLQALAVAAQVASALEEAERKQIIHRDIKPDNIIFEHDGSVKVTDFGISRQANVTRVTVTGVFVGTMAYTAPEQAIGRADIRSDIYSLGITLFEMLAGELPFRADTPTGLMRMHEEEPPPLDKLAGLPEPVVALVARCLEKDPANRFQHPSELLAAIEETRLELAPPMDETWAAETTAILATTRVDGLPVTRVGEPAAAAPASGGREPPWRRFLPAALADMWDRRRPAFIAALSGGALLLALLIAFGAVLATGGGGGDGGGGGGDDRGRAVLKTTRTPKPEASPTPLPTGSPGPEGPDGTPSGEPGSDPGPGRGQTMSDPPSPVGGGSTGGGGTTPVAPTPTPRPPAPTPTPKPSVQSGEWDFTIYEHDNGCGFGGAAGQQYTISFEFVEISAQDGKIQQGEVFEFRYGSKPPNNFTLYWPTITWDMADDYPFQDGYGNPDSEYRLDFKAFDSGSLQVWETYYPGTQYACTIHYY